MGYTFAGRITDTKVMLAGLATNLERLANRGLSKDFIDKMQKIYTDICAANNDREALKARLKESTVDLNGKMNELNSLFMEAKKMVKLELPQESWVEYGFSDKR